MLSRASVCLLDVSGILFAGVNTFDSCHFNGFFRMHAIFDVQNVAQVFADEGVALTAMLKLVSRCDCYCQTDVFLRSMCVFVHAHG